MLMNRIRTRALSLLKQGAPTWHGRVMRRREAQFWSWLGAHDPDAFQRLMRPDLPEPVRAKVAQCLAASAYRQLGDPLPATRRIDTGVLFAAALTRPDVIKEIIALKRIKPDLHCTLMTVNLSTVDALARRWIDRIVLYRDPVEFIRLMRTARADALILKLSGGMKDFFIPARLFFDGRLIHRPSGFITQMDGDFPWGDWPTAVGFEGEKFLTEHAEGIYHFYSPPMIDRLRRDGMRITCPTETIYPSCVRELGPSKTLAKLSARDGEIHLVYCSGIGERGADPAKAGEVQLWDKWRAIVEQRVHVHFYSPVIAPHDRRLIDYQQLAKDSPYFHMEQSLTYEELLAALTQYDAALHHMDFRKRANKPEALYHMTNTVWTYVQAGLPLIVSDAMPAMVDLVSRYGVGLIVPEDAIGSMRRQLAGVDLPALQARVRELADTEFQYPHERLWKLVFGTTANGKSAALTEDVGLVTMGGAPVS